MHLGKPLEILKVFLKKLTENTILFPKKYSVYSIYFGCLSDKIKNLKDVKNQR